MADANQMLETISNASGGLQSAAKQPSFFDEIQRMLPEVQKALVSPELAVQFIRQAQTLLRTTPGLQRCSVASFKAAMMTSAQLKLMLNPALRIAYLIPYKKNIKQPSGAWEETYECQFQIGIGGYIELFYRHEKSLSLSVHAVHQNDVFDYEYGTNSFLKHKPCMNDRGEAIGYYAVAKMHGATEFIVMSKTECLDWAKAYSQQWDKRNSCFYKGSSWLDDFDAMAKKTVVKQLCKTLPLSVEMSTAISYDGKAEEYKQDNNVPIPTEYEEVASEYEEIVPEEEPPAPEDDKELKAREHLINILNDLISKGYAIPHIKNSIAKHLNVVVDRESTWQQMILNAVFDYDVFVAAYTHWKAALTKKPKQTPKQKEALKMISMLPTAERDGYQEIYDQAEHEDAYALIIESITKQGKAIDNNAPLFGGE